MSSKPKTARAKGQHSVISPVRVNNIGGAVSGRGISGSGHPLTAHSAVWSHISLPECSALDFQAPFTVSPGALQDQDALNTDMEVMDKPQGCLSHQALLIQRKVADLLTGARVGAASPELEAVASVWSHP